MSVGLIEFTRENVEAVCRLRVAEHQEKHNDDFGIDAVSGVVDLGGNTASGNGNPLQCRNVFCG